ncbi:hypothetical protein PRUPE_5G221400 [Prunus persica]|uniref:Uncharacterized protein n=1 Tax=Prunus persica TaxID=3760 RepID=M5WNQ7_PRUPE|nr:uncharacterized protein LOC18777846 [Prunus persica]XP_007209719.1 uncharacterized protein LOC18777846 [Prunus persica]ONI09164.1 hypothetical protein PRUPE_5G221400 [Prunus persica]ONI09165.1 hypothetical protein PRUPE_5G221400 [Prunus persica]ONI09166.1 hypothetical protein PRUPE_5G221400 [Prunus persica]
MNRCAYEQNAMAGCEGMKMVDSVVCPKPRRLNIINPSLNDSIKPFRYFNQSEIGDPQAGSDELLDFLLTKGNCEERSSNQLASSPPFFCGSPPSRASNPVIQDEQFGNSSKMASFFPAPPSSLSARNGGCVRMKSGDKPVAVRIEGFDCLSRDRRNCSISAVA